ncbi:MAG: hypothetical protein C0456_18665, partial [Hyphomonas sp.]|uniref:LytTR family DNA-binding domain-containing protein n=1 Tax=Hyphomonas sp. TaxID=87 RepID=UPI001DE44A09
AGSLRRDIVGLLLTHYARPHTKFLTVLPHGFVRVHRSYLVRRAAIATTETRQSGDFDITLRSGAVISGSRRFRQNLA